jgi:hypothetical protein
MRDILFELSREETKNEVQNSKGLTVSVIAEPKCSAPAIKNYCFEIVPTFSETQNITLSWLFLMLYYYLLR